MALRPDALVVRAGKVRDAQTLKEKVDDAIADGAGAVVSIYCDVEEAIDAAMTLAELCAASGIPHGKVQVTVVSQLHSAGFEPILDVSDGQVFTHHHVVFEEPVQESRLQAFIDCFGEPVDNPAGGKRKR